MKLMSNPDRFSLYSISDVVPERFGSVILTGSEYLVFDPQPRLVPQLLKVEIENSARYRPLTTALLDTYRSLRGLGTTTAGLREFGRLTGDRSLGEQQSATDHLDLNDWYASMSGPVGSGRQPLVGASYVGRNLDLFIELLEKRCQALTKGAADREVRLIWFRPVGANWGATPDLQHAVSQLKSTVRRCLSNRRHVRASLVMSASVRRDARRRFGQILDEGLVAPTGHLSASTEVVLLQGIGAIMLVTVALSRTVSVPIGYAIVDRKQVSELERSLGLEAILGGAESLWSDVGPADRPDQRSSQDTP